MVCQLTHQLTSGICFVLMLGFWWHQGLFVCFVFVSSVVYWKKHTIIKFSKPLTSTFTLHRVFYYVTCTLVVIGCQRDLPLLGRLLLMSLRRTRCKLRLPRDALVKGLLNFIIVITVCVCVWGGVCFKPYWWIHHHTGHQLSKVHVYCVVLFN